MDLHGRPYQFIRQKSRMSSLFSLSFLYGFSPPKRENKQIQPFMLLKSIFAKEGGYKRANDCQAQSLHVQKRGFLKGEGNTWTRKKETSTTTRAIREKKEQQLGGMALHPLRSGSRLDNQQGTRQKGLLRHWKTRPCFEFDLAFTTHNFPTTPCH